MNDAGKPLKGSKICVLGVAYKKDVDDPRESPSFELMELLLAARAPCSATTIRTSRSCPRCGTTTCRTMASQELTPEFLASQDCVLIATDHSAYDYDFIVRHAPLVVDTRNATKNVQANRDRIEKT